MSCECVGADSMYCDDDADKYSAKFKFCASSVTTLKWNNPICLQNPKKILPLLQTVSGPFKKCNIG